MTTKLTVSINSAADNNSAASQQPARISISKKVVEEPDAANASGISSGSKLSQSVFTAQADAGHETLETTPKLSEDDIEKIVAERMAQRVAKYNAKFQEMRQQMEELESDKYEIQKQLNSCIQASVLVDEVFGARDGASDYQKRIIDTIREALDDAKDSQLPLFVVKFAKGWTVLQKSLSGLGNLEKGNPQLDSVCDALQYMLASISGCYVSERRTLLEMVAKHCCEYFQEYIFISPEHTLNVDPEIHNVTAAGGSDIKEGVSFAVIRSDTKKTVRYADVVLS